MREMRSNNLSKVLKTNQSAEIEQHIQKYLESGGRIYNAKLGETAYKYAFKISKNKPVIVTTVKNTGKPSKKFSIGMRDV